MANLTKMFTASSCDSIEAASREVDEKMRAWLGDHPSGDPEVLSHKLENLPRAVGPHYVCSIVIKVTDCEGVHKMCQEVTPITVPAEIKALSDADLAASAYAYREPQCIEAATVRSQLGIELEARGYDVFAALSEGQLVGQAEKDKPEGGVQDG